jgi:hypothetical protein
VLPAHTVRVHSLAALHAPATHVLPGRDAQSNDVSKVTPPAQDWQLLSIVPTHTAVLGVVHVVVDRHRATPVPAGATHAVPARHAVDVSTSGAPPQTATLALVTHRPPATAHVACDTHWPKPSELSQ